MAHAPLDRARIARALGRPGCVCLNQLCRERAAAASLAQRAVDRVRERVLAAAIVERKIVREGVPERAVPGQREVAEVFEELDTAVRITSRVPAEAQVADAGPILRSDDHDRLALSRRAPVRGRPMPRRPANAPSAARVNLVPRTI